MVYRVRLLRNKEIPYEIGGITADNEQEAINKAKKQVIDNGYWFPWENNIKQKFKSLSCEWIDIDK